jgi:hypothetical protein
MKFDEFNLQKKSNGEININYEHNKILKGQLIVGKLKNLVQYIEKEKLLTKNKR